MQVVETTKPVERTFDIKGITSKELSIFRKALSDFHLSLKDARASEDDHRKSLHREQFVEGQIMEVYNPLPPSLEESLAGELANQIRVIERTSLIPKG
jgi:hypothetical protein